MAKKGDFSWHELISRLPEKRPLIAGIVNATPDSFSDGKGSLETAERVAFALQLLNEGADILDIGAESTRPGAAEVAPDEEWRRLEGVLSGILTQVPDAIISVDTRHASTAEKSLLAGAKIINDVSGLTFDRSMAEVVSTHKCGVIISHTTADPEIMQQKENMLDKNAVQLVQKALEKLVDKAVGKNIARSCIMLDVGIGFGKSRGANYELLRNAHWFEEKFQLPFCWGVSRKSLLASENDTLAKRIAGSLALAVKLAEQNVSLLRVHDAAQTVAALSAARELSGANR